MSHLDSLSGRVTQVQLGRHGGRMNHKSAKRREIKLALRAFAPTQTQRSVHAHAYAHAHTRTHMHAHARVHMRART